MTTYPKIALQAADLLISGRARARTAAYHDLLQELVQMPKALLLCLSADDQPRVIAKTATAAQVSPILTCSLDQRLIEAAIDELGSAPVALAMKKVSQANRQLQTSLRCHDRAAFIAFITPRVDHFVTLWPALLPDALSDRVMNHLGLSLPDGDHNADISFLRQVVDWMSTDDQSVADVARTAA